MRHTRLTAALGLMLGMVLGMVLAMAGGAAAQTALPYSTNFDSASTGTLSGWSGPFVVLTTGNISAPNGFGEASATDGDTALFTGQAATANEGFAYQTTVTGTQSIAAPLLRASTDGQNAYLVNALPFSGGGSVYWYKKISGSLTQLGTATIPVYSAGTDIHIRCEVYGSSPVQLRYKSWADGTAEPPAWTATYSDSANSVTAAGVIGWRNGGGGQTVVDNLSVYASSASPLAAGTGSLVSVSNLSATVACTAASGGTAPYTYQLYRSEDPRFAPGPSTLVSGATSLTYTDTGMVPERVYYYTWVATDAVGATSNSGPVYTDDGGGSQTGKVLTSPLAATLQTQAPVSVGLLGDSNTSDLSPYVTIPAGQPVSVGAAIQTALQRTLGTRSVTVDNEAIGGTYTADWLPAAGSGYLVAAEGRFVTAAVTLVEINAWGTNDAGRTTAAQYQANLQSIIAHLYAHVPTLRYVVLSGSIYPWYDGRSDITANVQAMQQYRAVLRGLADNRTVYLGDMDSWQYFALHPEMVTTSVGVHLSPSGIVAEGDLRSLGIARVLCFTGPTAGEIVAALVASPSYRKIYAYTSGKNVYNPATHVSSLYDPDTQALLAQYTLTVVSGVTTQRLPN